MDRTGAPESAGGAPFHAGGTQSSLTGSPSEPAPPAGPGAGWAEAAARCLDRIRRMRPLIHHLTNFVVMQWTANVTLALGASPIMAQEPEEFPAVTGRAGALVLNIGSVRVRDQDDPVIALRVARQHRVPVVLDPVGAGFTPVRLAISRRLLEEGVTAVRGNGAEILALANPDLAAGRSRGVDSEQIPLEEIAEAAREVATRYGCAVVASGATDLVTDGRRLWAVENGHPILTVVTGGGCAATTAVAVFLAGSDDPARDAALAMAVYGLAAERAAARSAGPGSFQAAFLDELYALGGAGTARPDGLRIREIGAAGP
ncbi:MAG: hydroxyethylthiazole kinase [Firmicutes bacterium]|nr:hydroxyethylthiazole kinase [Bacillota bacterium]